MTILQHRAARAALIAAAALAWLRVAGIVLAVLAGVAIGCSSVMDDFSRIGR